MRKAKFNMKWFLIWILIHSVLLFLIGYILKYLDLHSGIVKLLIIGFGVSTFARIIRIFTKRRQFVVDRWFVFFSLINALVVWFVFIFLNYLNVSNHFLIILVTAIGLVLVPYFVRKFKITKTKLWVSVIIILLLLVVIQTSGKEDIVYSGSQSLENSSENVFDSIVNILPLTISKECPQINVSLKKVEPKLPYMDVKEYEGWKIAPYDTNTMMGFNFGKIHCHKGSKQGQNPDYWYCGDESSKTKMAFMKKTFTDSDGNIGKTIKQSFYNVYDEDRKFIKTVCGEDPDKIAERRWKEMKKEVRNFLD